MVDQFIPLTEEDRSAVHPDLALLIETHVDSPLVAAALSHAESELRDDTSGHDPSHVFRVFKLAQRIARSEGADAGSTALIAALHDVQDFKFTGDETSGPRAARAWLLENGASQGLADSVAADVAGISFKGAGTPISELSLAGRCVQDADRMDALGAIGIARCFAYGGSVGRPMHDPAVPVELAQTVSGYLSNQGTSVNHFYEKLLLLADRMTTSAGKRMALARQEYMKAYLAQFYAEWAGEDQPYRV